MNSGIDSSFRTWSPNAALEVRAFVAVLGGRRRRRFTVFRPLSTVVINNIIFWSFQPNSSIFPFSERLPYSLPHFRATFHWVLSSAILGSKSRLGFVCSRCALVPFVASRFSRLVVVVRIVSAALKPLSVNCDNNRADVKRLSSYTIWKRSLEISFWANKSNITAWVWLNPSYLVQ